MTAGQSACRFRCPVFEVEIRADGRVRHSGPSFAKIGGIHESRIDRRGLERIAKALSDVRFDEMRDSYQTKADGCENWLSDQSTLSFSVKRGSRTKTVHLYAGCLGPMVPAKRIGELIETIDQVAGTGALLEKLELQAR